MFTDRFLILRTDLAAGAIDRPDLESAIAITRAKVTADAEPRVVVLVAAQVSLDASPRLIVEQCMASTLVQCEPARFTFGEALDLLDGYFQCRPQEVAWRVVRAHLDPPSHDSPLLTSAHTSVNRWQADHAATHRAKPTADSLPRSHAASFPTPPKDPQS